MFHRLDFFIRHAFNDLKVNRLRSLFALLCIAAGVAAIVSLQTLAVMMKDTLEESLQESNRGDLRITPGGTWSQYAIELKQESMSIDGGNTVFTPAGIERIQKWLDENYPGSYVTYRQAVNGFNVAMSASIPERDTYKPFIYNFIIEADHYPLYGTVKSESGKALPDMLQEPTDIVISRNLADDLEAKVGDHLRMPGSSEDFTIRGIVPTDTEPGLQNFVAHIFGYFYLDVRSVPLFQDLVPGQASTVYVHLADPSKVERVAKQMRRQLSYSLSITTTAELKDANSQLSSTVDNLTVIMGLVSLLIGGVGIINTMLVIVSRRTLEVAVLKTVGLEPQEVILLFLVEAVLMGIVGSILGVLGGWGLALAVKGIAETFLAQSLTFRIALAPAVNGFVVGIVITAIFGFLPTLAAGKIRPANVLRPNDTIIPKAGRLSAFIAIVGLILALSLVTQSLIGNLLDVELTGGISLPQVAQMIGAGYGLAMGIAAALAGFLSMRERRRGRSWFLQMLIWLAFVIALPVLGALFGSRVPAILIMTVTVILVGYLYIALWLVIWAVGGGRISEIWPGVLVLLFPLFWPLIPVLIVLLIPTWILGRIIQRYTFIDFKVAMRSMLATKGRGASTMLALVVGVFTLSVITMLVDTITSVFSKLLEDGTGGNVLIMSAGNNQTSLDNIRGILSSQDGVHSFAIVGSYDARLTNYWDASTGGKLSSRQRQMLTWNFNSIDGRDIGSNLPDVTFTQGRNLDPALDSQPDADGYWPVIIRDGNYSVDFGVGDLLTFAVMKPRGTEDITFRVVGVVEDNGMMISDSNLYTPIAAFGDIQPKSAVVIANVERSKIPALRRSLSRTPGTFVLETRFLKDLLNRIIHQFTSFPLLVAALALVTGGIVIANSVALSTLERRREIAVMKAVGLQRERVLGMLLLENGLMGLVGGLIGVGISFVALALLLSQMFKDNLGDVLPYATAFSLMGLCILISLAAALLSVWGASGEKPLNVLRYE